MMAVPKRARTLTDALERATALDAPAELVANRLRRLLGAPKLKDAISGTWLGHPVHPPLTDVVIGCLTAVSVLDVLAPDIGDRAARRLITVGLAASLPAAVTGFRDCADTELSEPGVRRVGLVHSGANLVGLLLYCGSLIARRRGARKKGALLALAGSACSPEAATSGDTWPMSAASA